MLASDLNNPEFVGARNPDDMLHVEFYWHEPVDKWASETAQKIVKGDRKPFIRIMRPGDNTSIIEMAVRDDHKARWPQKWLAWQIREGLTEGVPMPAGWSIDEWDEVKDNQNLIHELKFLRFSTVEQVAGASDAQVQRMGIGGMGLREKAKLALQKKNRAEFADELLAKDKEMAEMRAQLDELKALVTGQKKGGRKVEAPTDEL